MKGDRLTERQFQIGLRDFIPLLRNDLENLNREELWPQISCLEGMGNCYLNAGDQEGGRYYYERAIKALDLFGKNFGPLLKAPKATFDRRYGFLWLKADSLENARPFLKNEIARLESADNGDPCIPAFLSELFLLNREFDFSVEMAKNVLPREREMGHRLEMTFKATSLAVLAIENQDKKKWDAAYKRILGYIHADEKLSRNHPTDRSDIREVLDALVHFWEQRKNHRD